MSGSNRSFPEDDFRNVETHFLKAPDRGGQPAPIPNDGPSMHDLLIEEVQKRKALGLSRYGTLLQAGNGRDALQDAIDELVDCLVYLIQVREETDAALASGELLEG